MTSEQLLDAIGLLDDGLIQEAERFSLPRRQAHMGQWLGLAASLALVVGLGYGAIRLGLAGGTSGSGADQWSSAAGGAANSAPAGSSGQGIETEINQEYEEIPEEPIAPEPDPSGGFIQLSQDQPGTYLLTGLRSSLPEDAAQLGVLSLSAPDAPLPSTNMAEYVGLELWKRPGESLPTVLYVVLPDGQCAIAELAEP